MIVPRRATGCFHQRNRAIKSLAGREVGHSLFMVRPWLPQCLLLQPRRRTLHRTSPWLIGSPLAAQLAEQFDVHPNQITSWKAQLEGGAADVFGPGGGNGAAPAAVDVKSLHAKIGELTLENDFLEGALTKAGLLSAKR